MNPRITRRAEWDGTFTLMVDGEPVSGRLSLIVLEPLEKFVDAMLKVKGLEELKVRVDGPVDGPNTVTSEWKENA
jgi:hypothetical protein